MSKYGLPLWTLALGLALNVVGVVSWLLSGGDSWTPLIPAYVGGLFILAGALSFKQQLRKHVIHGALVLALLLGVFMSYEAINELLDNGSVRKLFAFQNTAVCCLIYIAVGIKSFLHARKLRKQADAAVKSAAAADA
ncbi:MAG: hypothetical protein AAGG38_04555 [Planctomycetota bacterium]